MTPQEFTYWLQGFAELTDHLPDEEQWKSIKDHLALTFTKVTPPFLGPYKPGEVKGQDHRLVPLRSECQTAATPMSERTTTTC